MSNVKFDSNEIFESNNNFLFAHSNLEFQFNSNTISFKIFHIHAFRKWI